MGWLCYQLPHGRSVKDECDSKLTLENEHGKRRVLKSSMVGTVYYAAVETIKPDGSREVWAAVFLTKNGREFGYKDMDEAVGPLEAKCPVGILELLTDPPYNDYAKSWRAKCRTYHAAVKKKPKIGDELKFANKITFSDGHSSDFFRVETLYRRRRNMTVYRSRENNQIYRIPGLERLEFTVVAQ